MIVVTGTKRSGTSMWMQLLRAGGVVVMGDAFPGNWRETIGDANPHGFYESKLAHGINFRTNPDPSTGSYLFADETREVGVKVFGSGLVRSEIAYLDRVLVTMRPWQEHTASLLKLRALGASAHGLDDSRAGKTPLPPALEWWAEYYGLVRDAAIRRYPVHFQAYDRLLADPEPTLEGIFAWIGTGDPARAAAAIDPALHRNRRDALMVADPGLGPEVTRVFEALYDVVATGEAMTNAFIRELNETHDRLLPLFIEHRARLRFEAASRIAGGDDAPSIALARGRAPR